MEDRQSLPQGTKMSKTVEEKRKEFSKLTEEEETEMGDKNLQKYLENLYYSSKIEGNKEVEYIKTIQKLLKKYNEKRVRVSGENENLLSKSLENFKEEEKSSGKTLRSGFMQKEKNESKEAEKSEKVYYLRERKKNGNSLKKQKDIDQNRSDESK